MLLAACQPSNLAPTIIDRPDATIKDAGMDAEIVDAATEAEQVEAAPIVPKHQNILLIGDSQVQYADWFFKPLRNKNETVFFDSKPGTTIGWWNYDIFHREMNKYHNIDIVIIFLGTNNSNFTYLQPYHNILDEVKARKIKCIWVGPTAVYGKKHIINTLIKDAVSETCTYVDTEALDIPLADGVHPTQLGTVKWLTEIWKVKASL